MKLHPAGHRVLVKLERVEEEEVTASGIVVAKRMGNERMREQASVELARVIELGFTAYKGFDEGEAWCKPGDLVQIVRFSGVNHYDEETDEMYRVINDEDVYAIVEES